MTAQLFGTESTQNQPSVSAEAKADFWFVAEGATVATAAEALAEHYKISVFVPESIATKSINGTLRGGDLDESLDVLAFFAGVTWRKTGAVYYFGGSEPAQFLTLPSAGVDVEAVRSVLGDAVVVGDSVVVKTTPTQYAQLKEVLDKLRTRPVLKVRCAIVDISSSRLPAFRDFLNTAGSGVTITGDATKSVSVRLPVDIRAVLDFLAKDEDTEMKLDTAFALPSGEPLTLTSGSIVERPVYVRTEGDNSQDLVTKYDRLQLGLTVKLQPFHFDGKWFLRFDVQDADTMSGTEKRLSMQGAYEFVEKGCVQLASIDRTREVMTERRVPGLSRIRGVGRAFRSKSMTREDRSVIVFLELL
ncbi:hypothetical protein M2447_002801 [Ereboglobus sp. PH5-10]|uniref:FecR domain-containing protein n=1 Tax=Ereboglobus sp. PH5-10 TaxID=2940629 RepID=UPI002404E8B8|nr:FecR domain-containing protein [Ereboglobus sp. PH5-10]MDF9828673.1 hypothetical protein [Ereboglobus sp. PH5-10]